MISSYGNAFWFKRVSVLNWENFFLLSAIFLGISWCRKKRQARNLGLLKPCHFHMGTPGLLPSKGALQHFSQERQEEQKRGRICAAGEALLWSVRWSQPRLKCDAKTKKKAASGGLFCTFQKSSKTAIRKHRDCLFNLVLKMKWAF